tara:strand:- start:786 stop:3008 length:2223 start_codon:yes stop_codon:yes gene_type:complete
MKVIESNRTVDASEDFETVEFDMTKEARAHIFNVLRNQLYSDKILAILREYPTNAVDAHVEIGKGDLPIVVTLPNQMTPVYKVRDFGRGLSEKDIHETYSKYGESTKRNSNKQIGQLGLGCKSAFCYSDSFLILSHQKGKVTTYNAFIDPSNVGRIAKMHTVETDEDDGIEIQIPVDENDIHAFRQKAEEFFRYFKVTPVFRGQEIQIQKQNSIFEGKGWKMFSNGYTDAVAIMGNIGYPLNVNAIKWTDLDRDLKSMIGQNIHVDFEIGELEIAASREGLQYTDHTQKNIKDRLRVILAEVIANMTKNFDSCKTVFEAKIIYGKLHDYSSPFHRMSHLFKNKKLTVGNVEIKSNTYISYDQEGFTWRVYSHGRSGARRVRPEVVNTIRCFSASLIIINDVGPSGVLNRIAPIIELADSDVNNCLDKQYSEGVYLININDKAKWDAWVLKNGFDAPTINLSDLKKVKLADIYGATGNGCVKNSKHGQKVFSLDLNSTRNNWHPIKSDFFSHVEVDFDDDEGVYVEIDRFFCQYRNSERHPASMIKEIIGICEAIDESVPTIYAIKTGKLDNLGKGFVKFEDWAKTKILEFISKAGFEQAYVDITVLARENDLIWIDRLRSLGPLSTSLPSDIVDYENARKEMAHSACAKKIETLRRISLSYAVNVEQSKYKPTHELGAMQAALRAKYSLIEPMEATGFFGYGWANNQNDGRVKATFQYLQMVDRCAKLDAAKAIKKNKKS